jgi:polysaccharide export outer membrane protein
VKFFNLSFRRHQTSSASLQSTPSTTHTDSATPRRSLKKPLLIGWLCLELISLLLGGVVIAQKLSALEPGNTDKYYRLRGGDKLSIKFPYHAELNEPTVIVRPDGFITLPMIQDIQVVGLTMPQLKKRLEEAYAEVLVNPVISVNLTDFVMARVYVGGQVNKPGSYELRAGQTLLQAVMLAGGFTNDANRKMVLHARPLSDGRLKVTEHNALAMISKTKDAHDWPLQDGDYIFVPDAKMLKITHAVQTFSALLPGGRLIY